MAHLVSCFDFLWRRVWEAGRGVSKPQDRRNKEGPKRETRRTAVDFEDLTSLCDGELHAGLDGRGLGGETREGGARA
jgi:hypothetical protein